MTKIAIMPISSDQGSITYCAISNGKHSQGATAGEALDALTAQLTADETGTMVIVQNQRPDRFFNETQQRRLAELMARWRACRDEGKALPANEEAELDALINAELRGAAARAEALVDELKR
jgi:hypothetical protein